MNKKISADLQELIALIYELNCKSDCNWFMDFSGHVNSVSAHYSFDGECGECGTPKHKSVYITHLTEFEGIPDLIKKIRKEHLTETVSL